MYQHLDITVPAGRLLAACACGPLPCCFDLISPLLVRFTASLSRWTQRKRSWPCTAGFWLRDNACRCCFVIRVIFVFSPIAFFFSQESGQARSNKTRRVFGHGNRTTNLGPTLVPFTWDRPHLPPDMKQKRIAASPITKVRRHRGGFFAATHTPHCSATKAERGMQAVVVVIHAAT